MTDWIKLRDKLIRQVPWQASALLGHVQPSNVARLPDVDADRADLKFSELTGIPLYVCTEGIKQVRVALYGPEPAESADRSDSEPSSETESTQDSSWEDTDEEEEDTDEEEEDTDEEEEDTDEEEEDTDEEYTEDSLSAMSKQDLYALAAKFNVEGRSSMSKGELVEAILEADEE